MPGERGIGRYLEAGWCRVRGTSMGKGIGQAGGKIGKVGVVGYWGTVFAT